MSERAIRRNARRTAIAYTRRYGHWPEWAAHRPPKYGTHKKELRRIREGKRRAQILLSQMVTA